MKRLFDFVVSAIALALLSPVLLLTAACSLMVLGRPVLFRHPRPGKDGKLFTLLKFRTMRNAVDSDGAQLPDEARMTRYGAFLRRTSLDELPELINVLRGDMSLVGPRPLLPQYLPLYSPEQARRHLVRPGITGWAQINGRNSVGWGERFDLDVWYVDNQTFMLDMRILARTVGKVISGHGISEAGQATMTAFTGQSTGPNDTRGAKQD
jgi:lipopolysaccharide/colanic/teichoic acid biosynthesis glycosyltransferase